MPKMKDEHHLYIRSMGKALRVTAWFTDDDAANAWMERNSGHGVVAVLDGLILVANIYDQGHPIPRYDFKSAAA
jgi:hypothetical protein